MPPPKHAINGFGLIELVVILVMVGLMASVGVPAYNGFVERARIAKAIGDISSISLQIERFRLNNEDRVPDSLADISIVIPVDPWGSPYEFLNIQTAPNKGAVRKDGRLNPINTDFDLYSVGPDGDTAKPLRARASWDDIVRANNGAYIGLAEDY